VRFNTELTTELTSRCYRQRAGIARCVLAHLWWGSR